MMAPRPGVPSANDSTKTDEPTPSKKIKTEAKEHIDNEAEREVNDESSNRIRKRVPVKLRLGDFIPTTSALENRGSTSSPSSTTSEGMLSKSGVKFDRETDAAVLDRRRKQIEYGKNTPEYLAYCDAVARTERKSYHPRTPNQKRKYSRRAWDGLVKQWRCQLHFWSDPEQLALERAHRKELCNESFSSEATTASESDSQMNIDSAIKKKDVSWFEESEDFFANEDEDDDDNIKVIVK